MGKLYRQINPKQLPQDIELRWDVPERFAGQTVEIAFGGRADSKLLHDDESIYMRQTDRSLPVGDPRRVRYYAHGSISDPKHVILSRYSDAARVVFDWAYNASGHRAHGVWVVYHTGKHVYLGKTYSEAVKCALNEPVRT